MANDMHEEMAAEIHEAWSGWMRYLFSKCETRDDGSIVIPAESVARWSRQMVTPYADLSESEKDSDRAEVARCLRTMLGPSDDERAVDCECNRIALPTRCTWRPALPPFRPDPPPNQFPDPRPDLTNPAPSPRVGHSG